MMVEPPIGNTSAAENCRAHRFENSTGLDHGQRVEFESVGQDVKAAPGDRRARHLTHPLDTSRFRTRRRASVLQDPYRRPANDLPLVTPTTLPGVTGW